MTSETFTEESITKIESEFEKWQEFLNSVLGVFAFNASLTCISLNSPRAYGLLAFGFFAIAGYLGAKRFPPSFKLLREKKQRSKQEEIWYLGLKSKFLGFPAIFKNFPLYWLGVISLTLVIAGFLKNV